MLLNDHIMPISDDDADDDENYTKLRREKTRLQSRKRQKNEKLRWRTTREIKAD